MLKGKPFLIVALVFGSLGLLMLVITVASFFNGDDSTITTGIADLLHVDHESIKNETLAQISIVFFIPTFIFAYRSFIDTEASA